MTWKSCLTSWSLGVPTWKIWIIILTTCGCGGLKRICTWCSALCLAFSKGSAHGGGAGAADGDYDCALGWRDRATVLTTPPHLPALPQAVWPTTDVDKEDVASWEAPELRLCDKLGGAVLLLGDVSPGGGDPELGVLGGVTGPAPGTSLGSSYLLKWVAGVSFLQFWRNWDPLIVHLPVKGAPHGIPCLCFIPKVIVVNYINHWAHDGLAVPSDAV